MHDTHAYARTHTRTRSHTYLLTLATQEREAQLTQALLEARGSLSAMQRLHTASQNQLFAMQSQSEEAQVGVVCMGGWAVLSRRWRSWCQARQKEPAVRHAFAERGGAGGAGGGGAAEGGEVLARLGGAVLCLACLWGSTWHVGINLAERVLDMRNAYPHSTRPACAVAGHGRAGAVTHS